jgi:hypothetical protein
MEIIDFPGRKPKAIPTDINKMALGPLRFTCDCGNPTDLNLSGGIFRYIDFYCSSCGTHYKVTNPAFARPITRHIPPKK